MLSEAQVIGLARVCSKALAVAEILDESYRKEGTTDNELDAVRSHIGRLKTRFCYRTILKGPITKPIRFYSD